METEEFETIYCDIKKETGKAYLVDAYVGEDVWIPKSQLDNLHEVQNQVNISSNPSVEMILPEWLLKEKGLI